MKFFNLSIFALVLALAFPVKAFSQEVVIDFSDLTPGQVFVGDEYAGLGVTFTNTPSSHPMVIQDSSNPNLPAPSQDHFNPLQGNVLIVSKYKQPNGSQREYASPHSFAMEFSTPVTFGSITTMDNESRGSYIQAFGENGLIKKVDVPVVPDGTNNWENSLQVVRVDAEEVTRVVFFSKGSTFIDDISYDVPDPGQCPNPDGNAQLFNISTRAFVMDGPAKAIGGFIIQGESDLCVVIRGRGQSVGLPPEQESLLLPDPFITLFTPIDGVQTIIGRNDDWTDDLEQEVAILETGYGDVLEETDAAMYICLPPGPYTVHLDSAVPDQSGIGIIEIIDADNFRSETE